MMAEFSGKKVYSLLAIQVSNFADICCFHCCCNFFLLGIGNPVWHARFMNELGIIGESDQQLRNMKICEVSYHSCFGKSIFIETTLEVCLGHLLVNATSISIPIIL